MDQIKMADYSNFLSEADESNLQHEAILCEKRKKTNLKMYVINFHVYMFLFDFLRSFRQRRYEQHLKVSKSRKQFLVCIPNSSKKMNEKWKRNILRALKMIFFCFSFVFWKN